MVIGLNKQIQYGLWVGLISCSFVLMAAGHCLLAFAGVSESLPLSPEPGGRPARNPPVFTWPMERSGEYRLDLRSPRGTERHFRTERNWLTLTDALPIGEYHWRVFPVDREAPSKWFSFTLGAEAQHFPVPSADILIARAKSKSRPRTLSSTQILSGQYCSGAQQFLDKQHRRLSDIPSELPARGGPDRAQALGKMRRIVQSLEDSTLIFALCGRISGNRTWVDNAKQQALYLAQLDPEGITGFGVHDQTGRSITWTLALAFDWLHDEFSQRERAAIIGAISTRLTDMLDDGPFGLGGARRMDRNPYDSHGVTTLARGSVICSVMAGEARIFDDCFTALVPRYLALPVPWGGDDGGFSNGTAYAQWSLLSHYLVVWDLLGNALDIDMTRLPWARNHIHYLAYFLPPGTPTGLFGDEAEQYWGAVWATQAKAYAARFPSSLADWYARSQFGENTSTLAMLLAPKRDAEQGPVELSATTDHSLLVPSIGWVAMHSDLGDRARTSVYFKASPYGSFNHSHADQNSFVINARGRSLVIDSGYFDYYNSPHWNDWYKQTRAHNAITLDGGQGQALDSMKAKGYITQFEHHGDYDIATGDAREAYGGALTRALRSLVYLRPDTVLIFDSLASDTPHTWEWNLHALSRMKEMGGRKLEIEQDGVRLCVDLLEAPEGTIEQTNRFSTEPRGNYPAQWHARYASRAKSQHATFISLLDVGCHGVKAEVIRINNKYTTRIGERTFLMNEGHVEIKQ